MGMDEAYFEDEINEILDNCPECKGTTLTYHAVCCSNPEHRILAQLAIDWPDRIADEERDDNNRVHLDDARSHVLRDAVLLEGEVSAAAGNDADKELHHARKDEEQLPLILVTVNVIGEVKWRLVVIVEVED